MSTCTDILAMLDDYFDDELSQEDARTVAEHLEHCDSCQAELDAMRALRSELNALPRSIEPDAELWQGIEARLQKTEPVVFGDWLKARAASLAYAAAVAAAVALIVSTGLRNVQSPVTPEDAVAEDPVDDTFAVDQERQELRAMYAEHTDSLDPDLRAVMDENLAIIDRSVDDIRAALAENPEDPALERMLYAAVRSEASLLHQAVQGLIEG